MTDWRDSLPWRRHVASTVPARKAVTGAGVTVLNNDPPLRPMSGEPNKRAAAFLQAYKVGWFYKAESKIAGDISTLARTVAHEDEVGTNEATVVEPDLFTPWERLDPLGQFLRLMERPNPSQTGRQLFAKTQIRTDMAGWTFWYMEGAGPNGSGILPTALYGISPVRMTPSFDSNGQLIGWVMDANGRGGGIPFQTYEILQFCTPSPDDDYTGVGVVQAVWQELPLSEQMAKHTGDLLSTGGRLAGMMWPKNRALDEAEFTDAQRAWRNVSSDPSAAKRLLLFPEPMEWAAGASTPADIGIPDLATLNRDNILTAFPISPYMLGVPQPGGLNSGETRREDRRDYWEGTIHPRVELLEETIQVGMLSLYEAVLGTTYDFDIAEPNLDDAASLIEKVAAFDALVSAGFAEQDAIDQLGLDTMRWAKPIPVVAPLPPATIVSDLTAQDGSRVTEPLTRNQPPAAKSSPVRARDKVTDPATRTAKGKLDAFFRAQRERTVSKLRESLPPEKSARMKAKPTWWDGQAEDDELTKVMRDIYALVGRGALQEVADTLGRFVFKGATQSVIGDLLTFGGERIKGINEKTLQAITIELAEGTRRGYSIPQLIDGVPGEGFRGIADIGLDNGTAAWSELRAETIARTETMLSYNRATVTGYREFGITTLLAYDGDQDEECAARDGQEFSVDEAYGIDDHPNGTLVWSPVVDKAAHIETGPDPVTMALVDALKSANDRPIHPPIVNITNLPPETHIAPAAITVEPSSVQVDVHVPTPAVTVQNEVKALPAQVVITPASEVRISSMPDRVSRHIVKRNAKGIITESSEIETDG